LVKVTFEFPSSRKILLSANVHTWESKFIFASLYVVPQYISHSENTNIIFFNASLHPG